MNMADGTIADMLNDKGYIDSVLSNSGAAHIGKFTGRKRHLSDGIVLDDDEIYKSQKRSKPDNLTTDSDSLFSKARRSLYGSTPTSKNNNKEFVSTAKNVQSSCSALMNSETLSKLIIKLSEDVSNLSSNLSKRIDELENSLESRISHKISNILDKRINSEVANIKKSTGEEIKRFKEEMQHDMRNLEEKFSQLSDTNDASKRLSNVVIKGLEYHEGENLNRKVENLFIDGLGLCDVHIVKTERKNSDRDRVQGIVVCTLQSTEDRKRILAAKIKLKDSNMYKKVFIFKDQSFEERSLNRNFQTIVNALRSEGCDISLKGNRVVTGNMSKSNRGSGSNLQPDGSSRGERQANSNSNRASSPRNNGDFPSGRRTFNGNTSRENNERNTRGSFAGQENRGKKNSSNSYGYRRAPHASGDGHRQNSFSGQERRGGSRR